MQKTYIIICKPKSRKVLIFLTFLSFRFKIRKQKNIRVKRLSLTKWWHYFLIRLHILYRAWGRMSMVFWPSLTYFYWKYLLVKILNYSIHSFTHEHLNINNNSRILYSLIIVPSNKSPSHPSFVGLPTPLYP